MLMAARHSFASGTLRFRIDGVGLNTRSGLMNVGKLLPASEARNIYSDVDLRHLWC